MPHYSITVKTDNTGAELVSDAFFSLEALGVRVEDGQAYKEAVEAGLIWDYADDAVLQPKSDNTVTLTGFFETDDIISLQGALNENLSFYGLTDCVVSPPQQVDQNEWYEKWKSYYKPVCLGKYVIVPAWQEYSENGKITVKIDPGMAFGTGEHESTRLALTLMSGLDLEGKSFYDIGCGSGILGIAAALSGAENVTLVDIDEVATDAARINIKLNDLKSIKVICAPAPQGLHDKVDLIAANLTADLLIALKNDLRNLLKDRGRLIASGIIGDREKEVIEAFEKSGFKLIDKGNMGEWRALLLAQ
ncbi:MAG: 50S ribosomal protein L11 methyltransferase [Christensenellales bacterium]|jgi:ribosomal protein L11 methyltransferase